MSVVKRVYDAVLRRHLPRKIATMNGVAVRQPRLFDRTDVIRGYEVKYNASLEEAIRPGDRVVLVGGGMGVSSVRSARAAGPDGHVDVFEASVEHVSLVCETVDLNQPKADVDVYHALVGEAVDVWGDHSEAGVVSPTELPECDVLGLDCEGAEPGILDAHFGSPREVVVEYHGKWGAHREDIEELLESAGYRVVSHRDDIPEEDIGILRAVRD